MKRATALLLAAVLLSLTFASCSRTPRVKVNGAKIDGEIYTYYNDCSENEEAALKAVERYTAVNSEFKNRGLSLSRTQKADLITAAGDIWHLYGRYYESAGISKQTIYKIEQSKAYEQSLLLSYYSENGSAPVPEEQLKQFFTENYAAIRYITGYLFNIDDNGAAVPMSEEQRKNTVESFNSVASMINGGTAAEEAAGALGENTEVQNAVVTSFSDGSFPTGFWNAVKEVENGRAAAVTVGDYVFLVLRTDVMSEEYDYYRTYRADCLNKMKGEEFRAIVDKWAENYKAE